jgi:hypothetical protein
VIQQFIKEEKEELKKQKVIEKQKIKEENQKQKQKNKEKELEKKNQIKEKKSLQKINSNFLEENIILEQVNVLKCQRILKYGFNKGSQCSFSVFQEGLCKRHYQMTFIPVKI